MTSDPVSASFESGAQPKLRKSKKRNLHWDSLRIPATHDHSFRLDVITETDSR